MDVKLTVDRLAKARPRGGDHYARADIAGKKKPVYLMSAMELNARMIEWRRKGVPVLKVTLNEHPGRLLAKKKIGQALHDSLLAHMSALSREPSEVGPGQPSYETKFEWLDADKDEVPTEPTPAPRKAVQKLVVTAKQQKASGEREAVRQTPSDAWVEKFAHPKNKESEPTSIRSAPKAKLDQQEYNDRILAGFKLKTKSKHVITALADFLNGVIYPDVLAGEAKLVLHGGAAEEVESLDRPMTALLTSGAAGVLVGEMKDAPFYRPVWRKPVEEDEATPDTLAKEQHTKVIDFNDAQWTLLTKEWSGYIRGLVWGSRGVFRAYGLPQEKAKEIEQYGVEVLHDLARTYDKDAVHSGFEAYAKTWLQKELRGKALRSKKDAMRESGEYTDEEIEHAVDPEAERDDDPRVKFFRPDEVVQMAEDAEEALAALAPYEGALSDAIALVNDGKVAQAAHMVLGTTPTEAVEAYTNAVTERGLVMDRMKAAIEKMQENGDSPGKIAAFKTHSKEAKSLQRANDVVNREAIAYNTLKKLQKARRLGEGGKFIGWDSPAVVQALKEHLQATRPTKKELFAFMAFLNLDAPQNSRQKISTENEDEAGRNSLPLPRMRKWEFDAKLGTWEEGKRRYLLGPRARVKSEVASMAESAGYGTKNEFLVNGTTYFAQAVAKLENLPPSQKRALAGVLTRYAAHARGRRSEVAATDPATVRSAPVKIPGIKAPAHRYAERVKELEALESKHLQARSRMIREVGGSVHTHRTATRKLDKLVDSRFATLKRKHGYDEDAPDAHLHEVKLRAQAVKDVHASKEGSRLKRLAAKHAPAVAKYRSALDKHDRIATQIRREIINTKAAGKMANEAEAGKNAIRHVIVGGEIREMEQEANRLLMEAQAAHDWEAEGKWQAKHHAPTHKIIPDDHDPRKYRRGRLVPLTPEEIAKLPKPVRREDGGIPKHVILESASRHARTSADAARTGLHVTKQKDARGASRFYVSRETEKVRLAPALTNDPVETSTVRLGRLEDEEVGKSISLAVGRLLKAALANRLE